MKTYSMNFMNIKQLKFYLSLVLGIFYFNITLAAENYSQNAYGGVGLIETPTARFSPDGEFMFGASSGLPINRIYSRVQIFPWMESTLRYTEETYRTNNTKQQTNKDKGLDVKFKLTSEGYYLPQIALGFNDIGGTGRYASEYIVASKKIRDIDITLGVGWGRLGGVNHIPNFVGWIDDVRDRNRAYKFRKGGGKFEFGNFFVGEYASVFGGMEFLTPIENLSLKLEYDTSNYTREEGLRKKYDEVGDIFSIDSRLNIALNYKLNYSERDRMNLSVGFLRGNTLYLSASVQSNLNDSGIPKIRLGAENLKVSNIDAYSTQKPGMKKFITDTIIWQMANVGFVTHKIVFNEDEISAEISQSRFLSTDLFIQLASRILANNSPKNIKKITVINVDHGLHTFRTTITRDELTESARRGIPPDEIIFNTESNLSSESFMVENDYLYPNFYWSFRPKLNYTIQHQEQFFFWQLEGHLHTEYSIKKGLVLTTDIGIDITNNFDAYTYHIPDGKLYDVRQDRRKYLLQGKTGLRRMAFDYNLDLTDNIKARFSAGLLEWMYGGVGGEIIYIPDNRMWGVGLDAYWVKQRDFDQKFSFKKFETVTGFLSLYRDIPFYNMRMKLNVGKFLGTDVGTMIDISRRFETGARVGGFVTLTDCDSRCVGEGSFHKGIYFEIPMDLFFIESSTRNKTGYSWSPLTKNAGQKIENISLYELATDASDEMESFRKKQWSFGKIISGFSTKSKAL